MNPPKIFCDDIIKSLKLREKKEEQLKMCKKFLDEYYICMNKYIFRNYNNNCLDVHKKLIENSCFKVLNNN
jgi:hypothetical protein